MKTTTVLFALLAAVFFHQAHANVVFEVSNTPSCSGEFSVSSFSSECPEGGCGFGSDFNFQATVSSSNGFPDEDISIEVKACLMGVICKTVLEETTDICSMGFEAADGQECGEAGTYSVDTGFKLPGDDENQWFNTASGYWIDVTATLSGDDFTTTTCTVSLKAKKNNYQMAAMSLIGVALVGACAVQSYRRRKRRVMEEEQENQQSLSTLTDFEMMKDPVSASSRTGALV